jgi:hypothetical protein
MTRIELLRGLKAEIESAERNLNALRGAYDALLSATKISSGVSSASGGSVSNTSESIDNLMSDGKSRHVDEIHKMLTDCGQLVQKASINTALSRGAARGRYSREAPGIYRLLNGTLNPSRAATANTAPPDDAEESNTVPSDDDIPF